VAQRSGRDRGGLKFGLPAVPPSPPVPPWRRLGWPRRGEREARRSAASCGSAGKPRGLRRLAKPKAAERSPAKRESTPRDIKVYKVLKAQCTAGRSRQGHASIVNLPTQIWHCPILGASGSRARAAGRALWPAERRVQPRAVRVQPPPACLAARRRRAAQSSSSSSSPAPFSSP
jgi:hypothetical protein